MDGLPLYCHCRTVDRMCCAAAAAAVVLLARASLTIVPVHVS